MVGFGRGGPGLVGEGRRPNSSALSSVARIHGGWLCVDAWMGEVPLLPSGSGFDEAVARSGKV
uniref:Uncharacterized protein n=1 Tax=Setaria italica TaxID=4555 RepID=K4AN76_SETIT